MSKRFLILLASQVTNMAPLVAYLFLSNTLAFADFVFIMLLGQLIGPVLLLRLDIQVQVELFRSRQRYYFGIATWLLALTAGSAFFLSLVFGADPYQGRLPLGILFGAAVSLQGLARAYAVARDTGLGFFEITNIGKNVLALALAFAVPEAALAALFVYANLAHGVVAVATLILRFGAGTVPGILYGLAPLPKPAIALRRARRVLAFSLPNSFIGMATGRLPILAIEQVFTPAIAAGFLAANRLALSPLSFVIAALRIVGVIEVNKLRRGEPNKFIFLVALVSSSAPIVLLPLLFPEVIAPFASRLDSTWGQALDSLPMLYPWAVAFLLAGWLDRVYDTLGTQGYILLVEIFMFCVMLCVSALIWSRGASDPLAVLWVFVIASTLHSLLWVGVLFLSLRKRGRNDTPHPA